MPGRPGSTRPTAELWVSTIEPQGCPFRKLARHSGSGTHGSKSRATKYTCERPVPDRSYSFSGLPVCRKYVRDRNSPIATNATP
jgi:hypothetical protein